MSRLYHILEETFVGTKVVIVPVARVEASHRLPSRVQGDQQVDPPRVGGPIAKPTTELLVMGAVFIAMLPAAYLGLHNTDNIWGIKLANSRVDMASLAVLGAARCWRAARSVPQDFEHLLAAPGCLPPRSNACSS
ncbi:MAG: hypothetical protein R3B90_10315 [Planctomycetaceae bacterium]